MVKKLLYICIGITLIIFISFLVIYFSVSKEYIKSNGCSIIKNEPLLLEPIGISVDDNENIYVADFGTFNFGIINVYNEKLDYLYSIKTNCGGSISINVDENHNLKVAYIRSNKVKTYDIN